MRFSSMALLPLLLLTLTDRAVAAPDFHGREGYYDLTGASEMSSFRLDYAYIAGDAPTYAERLGLAGAPTVETRRNFVYVQDSDGSLTIPYQSNRDVQMSFNFALRELYRIHPDEFVFIYLFTSFDTGVGAFFYSPEANDVRGLGSQIYDQNGPSPREGFVFMNYWRSMEEMFGPFGPEIVQAQGRSIFNQEAGHRWASFVTMGSGNLGGGSDLLLGRDDGHWSYFLNSGGSPMEGNAWVQNANGTFSTTTNPANWSYSQLDLYLMGLIGPDQVQPFWGIESPTVLGGGRDLTGRTPTRSSPPQIVEPVTVSGTRVDFTIEDLTYQNASRVPAFPSSPNTWRVAFVMLAGRSSGLNENQKLEFERYVDEYATGFKEGTRNLGTLDYQLIPDPVPLPIGGECADISGCDQTAGPLFCYPRPGVATGICTKLCSGAAECPTDWCCTEVSTGVTCMPPSELPGGTCPMPIIADSGVLPACACDTNSDCQTDCLCDANCTAQPTDAGVQPIDVCACDETFACDMDSTGNTCACDLECGDESGCGCNTVPGQSGALFGSALMMALLIGLRRRR
jgi:hypothetical protein